jgi:hypothetical protein
LKRNGKRHFGERKAEDLESTSKSVAAGKQAGLAMVMTMKIKEEKTSGFYLFFFFFWFFFFFFFFFFPIFERVGPVSHRSILCSMGVMIRTAVPFSPEIVLLDKNSENRYGSLLLLLMLRNFIENSVVQ